MESKKFKILLIDDEPDILEFLKYSFEKEGYITYTASNGFKGEKIALEINPDMIILDIMMPGMDGIELCNKLKENSQFKDTIIVFLTARGEDYSQIAGFDAGADDYVTKPVKPKVLLARIKAILKRNNKEMANMNVIELKDIKIDTEKRVIIFDNREIFLPKIEFNILLLFASNPGRVFVREEIYNRIWGNDIYVGDRTLDVHIRKLRKKLDKKVIKTIKGIGYGISA